MAGEKDKIMVTFQSSEGNSQTVATDVESVPIVLEVTEVPIVVEVTESNSESEIHTENVQSSSITEAEQQMIATENPRDLPVFLNESVEVRSTPKPDQSELYIGCNEESAVLDAAFGQLEPEHLLRAVRMYSEVVDNVLKIQPAKEDNNPILKSMEIARKGVARIDCPGLSCHGAKCVVKSVGLYRLKGYNEIEVVDANDIPDGNGFYIGSVYLKPIQDQSSDQDLSQEIRALQSANSELVAANQELQEQLQSLQSEPIAGPSGLSQARLTSLSSEAQSNMLVTTRQAQCDICGKYYGNRHSLATHKNRKHKPRIPPPMQHCERCNRYFEAALFLQHTCQSDDANNM
jgi:hypothetical protein